MIKLRRQGGVYVVGDIHGRPEPMASKLAAMNVRDADIILLGDIGLGFNGNLYNNCASYLNRIAADRNNMFHLIRGNHDNPACWNPETIKKLHKEYGKARHGRHVNFIPDMTVLSIGDKKVLTVGGAVSVDRCYGRKLSMMDMEVRTHRVEGVEWWPDETMDYAAIEALDIKVDAVLAHTGPVPPSMADTGMLERIQEVYDPNLLEDVSREKAAVDAVIERTGAKMWWNGHYHLKSDVNEVPSPGVKFMPGGASLKEFKHGQCHVVNLGINEIRKLELI